MISQTALCAWSANNLCWRAVKFNFSMLLVEHSGSRLLGILLGQGERQIVRDMYTYIYICVLFPCDIIMYMFI
jgi:hypothetical protein